LYQSHHPNARFDVNFDTTAASLETSHFLNLCIVLVKFDSNLQRYEAITKIFMGLEIHLPTSQEHETKTFTRFAYTIVLE